MEEGKKAEKKISPKKYMSDGTAQRVGKTVGIVTIYLTPFLFSLFVFHLEHLSSLTPNRRSCFLGSFIRSPLPICGEAVSPRFIVWLFSFLGFLFF